MAILVTAVVSWGWVTSWRRLPHFDVASEAPLTVPIMPGKEYAGVIDTHPRPYLVRVDTGRGSALIYGAEHTKSPADPALDAIRREWEAFEPTVALCESRLGVLFPQLMDPVREFGEPGLVHALARKRGIPTYTWEPTPAQYMTHLQRQPFTKEQLALRVKFGAYFSNRRHGRPADPESFVADAVGNGSKWPGLEDTLPTVRDLEAAWKSHFPDGPDWREVSDQYGLPGFLAEIDTNTARDEHFVRIVASLVRGGHRVFAVAGSSHAVKIEAALKAALVP
ncbi:MAG: hypothetical protein K2X87_01780 [Gemmataceae bacterium]|nr:hypothetical protein [Gemmataceae bacterium]